MSASRLERVWKDESFQTAVIIFFIVSLVFGFWYGSRLFLNTQYPMLAVASGSMSLAYPDSAWSYPFAPTLHTGDLIVIEGINASDIRVGPAPVGDIIVFWYDNELIVHRAVNETIVNGQIEFVTEGDGNAARGEGPGPGSPTPAGDVVGKVVMRIPWVGNVALFMRNSNGIIAILVLIIILIIIEFALPPVLGKKPADERDKDIENAPKPEASK